MKLIDLTGQRFGRWTVMRRGANSGRGVTRWECVCGCGEVGTVYPIFCSMAIRNPVAVYSVSLQRVHTGSTGMPPRPAVALLLNIVLGRP